MNDEITIQVIAYEALRLLDRVLSERSMGSTISARDCWFRP